MCCKSVAMMLQGGGNDVVMLLHIVCKLGCNDNGMVLQEHSKGVVH